ncbi:hypothetical protein HOI83_02305 [Candidatus Uhrbacteria bacterium]|jgi:hypothetical protein|nr:hypothetical protein [Candidatus Uhrbacteria bacterium]
MPDTKHKQSRKGWSTFSLEQKVAFVVFGVTGVLGLGLSMTYMVQQVKAPFVLSYDGERYESYDQRAASEIAAQKERDTDSDGINDYDELNVYRTSPYLADSDSDGFDDGREIKSGDDPNCPVGQGCGRTVEVAVNSPLVAADTRDKLPFEEVGLGVNLENEGDIEALLTALTSDDIRAALVAEGIDQETVDGLSDEEVRVLFDEALKSLQESGALDAILTQ